jgi:hypothetical protein
MPTPAHEFGQVAPVLMSMGWRPIPLNPATKVPAEAGWQRFNTESCPPTEMAAMALYHGEAATGIAIPGTTLALDSDIMDEPAAMATIEIADRVFGRTPLRRIGMPPKIVLIYQAAPGLVSSKPHPLELYSGTGQVVAYGMHARAGRPYQWTDAEPLTTRADDPSIPVVDNTMVATFMQQAAPILAGLRRARKAAGGNGAGIGLDASQQLAALLRRRLPFRRAAMRVLQSADAGGQHFAVRAVVSAGFNRGMDAAAIERLIERAAPADLLQHVTADNYLERVLRDMAPAITNHRLKIVP